MIDIHNLTYQYDIGGSPALNNVDLTINDGEHIGVIGPNGCGKTTLIRHFNALLLPSAGEVLVDGLDTRLPKNHLEIRKRVGMVFQNPDNQIVSLSVEEDVAFGPGNLRLPSDEIRRRVDQALAMVGLTGLEKRPPYTLSGGQKQLLALAGLLARGAQTIILDEPTSSLDAEGRQKVMDLLQKLKRQGIGIIHVSHNMDEIAAADRVLVLDRGNIAADGVTAEILSRVEWLKSLGMAPPRVSELMWELQRRGAKVRTGIVTAEEAVHEITALLGMSGQASLDSINRKADRDE